MGKVSEVLDDEGHECIATRHLVFVATAPLPADGHVNLSPKGLDTFREPGPLEVAYLDPVGSGVEPVTHVRENGRITTLFRAFTGLPRILRLYGQGKVVEPGDEEWDALRVRSDAVYPSEQAASWPGRLPVCRPEEPTP